ncbi:MAG TPA: GyrI-like domain-containing protein [Streptosporangiaceae bacterium]|nr:GyrI-like domain-containing protein [Streptosporangiaceae bacterium]
MSVPEIVTRTAQPYVAIRGHVSMAEIGAFAVRTPEVYAWLGARDLTPAGPPFLKYNVIDMARQLEIDNGVPVAAPVDSDVDAEVISGVLPAGRYAMLTHVGHPSELMGATKTLLDWAAGQGLTWDMSPDADGDRWGSRLEIYLTDPREEPDMSKWVTQLAFRLAD